MRSTSQKLPKDNLCNYVCGDHDHRTSYYEDPQIWNRRIRLVGVCLSVWWRLRMLRDLIWFESQFFTMHVPHNCFGRYIQKQFPRAACSSALHDGFWGVKYIILIAFYIVSYFIPYKFYDTWGGICLIFSFFFLVIQGYFILNLAYTWNDLLMDAMNGRDGSSYAQFLLLCYSILNAVGVVVWLVF